MYIKRYEGESLILTKDPVLEGKLRGCEDTYECFWGVGVRIAKEREGISVAVGALGACGGLVEVLGTLNMGSGAPTGGEDMDVVGAEKLGWVPAK
jgi:hypothetical protein